MKYDNTRHMWTKLTILSLLFIAGTVLIPLLAQESCYEKYMCEHNMKILTAEDADDSYDELKKTVLAKQMYGDSYLLMVDTVAQRTVITKVDGTYIVDVHVALVDSTWYMWLSVDPMADKNIATSPYVYANNNPIRFIDPDGRDWYETNEGTIAWTNYHNQTDLNTAGVSGRYLGEAVVLANGSMNERIGTDKTLTGEGAKPAQITIYGMNSAEDISMYNGLTTTSDPNTYSMIAPGEYHMSQEKMPSSVFAKGSLTYRIKTIQDSKSIPTAGAEINKQHPKQGTFMNGIYFHRTNWNGNALGDIVNGSPVSAGCVVVDGRQWRNVENQLGTSQSIFFRLAR